MDHIQVHTIWQGNTQRPSAVRLTFQHWGIHTQQATDAQRWNQMAVRIRAAYHQLTAGTFTHPHFLIEMIAGDEQARQPLSRPFSNVNNVYGPVLSEFFEEMLQSDETLELEGLTVVITLIGEDMQNRRGRGRGRTLGMKLIPARLKNKGVLFYFNTRPDDSSFF